MSNKSMAHPWFRDWPESEHTIKCEKLAANRLRRKTSKLAVSEGLRAYVADKDLEDLIAYGRRQLSGVFED